MPVLVPLFTLLSVCFWMFSVRGGRHCGEVYCTGAGKDSMVREEGYLGSAAGGLKWLQ